MIAGAEGHAMNEVQLDAEIVGIGRLVELGPKAVEADRAAWRAATSALREWKFGPIRVRADWPAALESESVRIPMRVSGTSDAGTYAELFLHDAFLIFNLASPGSLGGTFSLPGMHEFTLDARLHEYGWATNDAIRPLPLERVASWYAAQRVDAMHPAATPLARVFFVLLHLARNREDELLSIVRLAQACEALGLRDEALFAMRDVIVRGDAAVLHPCADDDGQSLECLDIADGAAGVIVAALQERISR